MERVRGVSKLINNLPNIVREWLAADKNRTQRDLAKEAGIEEATLSRILNSSRLIVDLEKAAQLQRVIGFKTSDLIVEIPDN